MATLSNPSVVISANAQQLQAGLSKASEGISQFASKAKQTISGVFSASLTGNMGAVASSITGPLGAAFGAVGGAFAGTIMKAVSAATAALTAAASRMKSLGSVNRNANALGMDPSRFQALDAMLKDLRGDSASAGDFIGTLAQKMDRAATTGAGPMARALERMGIDAREMMNVPTDQWLELLANGLQSVENHAQKAQACVALFGSTDILPMLSRGSEGLREIENRMRAAGRVLGPDQLQIAGQATSAWTRMKREWSNLWEGFKNTITIGLAPVLTWIADKLKWIGETLGWVTAPLRQRTAPRPRLPLPNVAGGPAQPEQEQLKPYIPIKSMIDGSAELYNYRVQFDQVGQDIGLDPNEVNREILREHRRGNQLLENLIEGGGILEASS